MPINETKPKPFTKGEPLSADRLNSIVSAVKRRIIGGKDIFVSDIGSRLIVSRKTVETTEIERPDMIFKIKKSNMQTVWQYSKFRPPIHSTQALYSVWDIAIANGLIAYIGGNTDMSPAVIDTERNLVWEHTESSIPTFRVAIDTDGNVYTAFGDSSGIKKFDNAGNFVWQVATRTTFPFSNYNRGIAADTNYVYAGASNATSGNLDKLNASDGSLDTSMGSTAAQYGAMDIQIVGSYVYIVYAQKLRRYPVGGGAPSELNVATGNCCHLSVSGAYAATCGQDKAYLLNSDMTGSYLWSYGMGQYFGSTLYLTLNGYGNPCVVDSTNVYVGCPRNKDWDDAGSRRYASIVKLDLDGNYVAHWDNRHIGGVRCMCSDDEYLYCGTQASGVQI